MKFDYVMDTRMPISVTVTYRDLELIKRLIEHYDGDNKWIFDDLGDEVKEAMVKAAHSAKITYATITDELKETA